MIDRKKRIEDKARFVSSRPWTAEEKAKFAGLVLKIKAKKAAERGGETAEESATRRPE